MTRFDQAKAITDGADAALTRLIRQGVQFEEIVNALNDYTSAAGKVNGGEVPHIGRDHHDNWHVIQVNGLSPKRCASLQEAIFEYLDRLRAASTLHR